MERDGRAETLIRQCGQVSFTMPYSLRGCRQRDHTFIDFGCGKGRAILLAAEYPFAKIIGVELAPELAQIAQRNIQSYRNPKQRCFDLSIVNEDATRFKLPDKSLVLFLYNPFESEVMERFIQNVQHSIAHSPRDLTIIYLNPQHDELWKAVPEFTNAWRNNDVSIYNYNPNQLADVENPISCETPGLSDGGGA